MARARRSDGMEMIITVDDFLGQGQAELRWACVGGRLTVAWPGIHGMALPGGVFSFAYSAPR
jgi:hypothetical protein